MSSETITRNDLKAVLDEVLPGSPLIHTTTARYAELTITSHDSVCSIIIQPSTMSATTPAIEMDISSSGSITIYANTGGGWQHKRTI